jgi:hypothetical protein
MIFRLKPEATGDRFTGSLGLPIRPDIQSAVCDVEHSEKRATSSRKSSGERQARARPCRRRNSSLIHKNPTSTNGIT